MRRGNVTRHGNFTWSSRLSWPTSEPQLPVLYESNTRVQATTRLLVIEPILTGVDVFAANGTSAVMLHDDGHRANDPSFARCPQSLIFNNSFEKLFLFGSGPNRRRSMLIVDQKKFSEENPWKFLIAMRMKRIVNKRVKSPMKGIINFVQRNSLI
jgi:hypothetical protein